MQSVHSDSAAGAIGPTARPALSAQPDTQGLVRSDDGSSGMHGMEMDPAWRAACRFPAPAPGHMPLIPSGSPALLMTGYTLVVGCEPLPHECAAVPGRIVPDQYQCLLAIMGYPVGDPSEIVTGDLAHGPPGDKAPQHGVRLRQQEAITCECLAARVGFGHLFVHEAQGLGLRPSVHRRLGQAAPPDFVLEAQRQGGTLFPCPQT